jgi:hypothetical protein
MIKEILMNIVLNKWTQGTEAPTETEYRADEIVVIRAGPG